MEPNSQEISFDIEELKNLLQISTRPHVKQLINAEIQKLSKISEPISSQLLSGNKTVAPPTKFYKDITNYGWDQSDNFFKVYITINGVHKIEKDNISLTCNNRSFHLKVENLCDKNFQCHVTNLWGEIVSKDSYHKVKTDMVVLFLKKKEINKTWAYATLKEDKKMKTPKMDDKKDPNEGLMDLLKQMYEDGDDEMKRTIAKSFSESRNKQMDI